MVEQSLLERFASPLPSIEDFFRGAAARAGRPLHVEHHFQLSARHAADQPQAAGGERSRGDRQGGSGKPERRRLALGRFAAAQHPLFGDRERADAPRINITEEAEEELGVDTRGRYDVNAGQYVNDAVKSSVFSRSGATLRPRFPSRAVYANQQRRQAKGQICLSYVQGLNLSVEFNDGDSRANELAANGIFTQDLSMPFPKAAMPWQFPKAATATPAARPSAAKTSTA